MLSTESAKKHIHVNSTADVPKVVADFVAEKYREAVAERDNFYIGLSGGSVAKFLGQELPKINDIDWSKWQIYFCDERLVPFDHDDSTYRIYKEQLAGKVNLPLDNIHRIDYSLSVEEAAKHYATQLEGVPKNDKGVPVFDLLVLGMGPDGHTCSLFPGHKLLDEKSVFIAPISDSPKPPPCRVTMTYPVINAARCLMYASTGSSKADVVQRVLEGNEAVPLPAARVSPENGELHWFLDEGAAAKITPPRL